MTIEEFITASNAATALDELFSGLSEACSAIGFEMVTYAHLTKHPSMNTDAGVVVATTYPQDYIAYYVDKKLFQSDPGVPCCFAYRSAFTWDQILSIRDLPKYSLDYVKELNCSGMVDGVMVPLHGPHSEVACLGLASSGRVRADRDTLSKAQIFGVQFHTAFARLASTELPKQLIKLTERECEILLWSAEGKSVGVIGEILGTSENNVKYHLKKIYHALGVTDRVQAVLKARLLGLINPATMGRFHLIPDYPVR